MANVQAGDRAVVVRDDVAANIGKIVSVVERMNPMPLGHVWVSQFAGDLHYALDPPLEAAWGVESLGLPFSFGEGNGTSMTAVFDDGCLRKLPDLKDEDEALPLDVAKPSARAVEFSRW